MTKTNKIVEEIYANPLKALAQQEAESKKKTEKKLKKQRTEILRGIKQIVIEDVPHKYQNRLLDYLKK